MNFVEAEGDDEGVPLDDSDAVGVGVDVGGVDRIDADGVGVGVDGVKVRFRLSVKL
jgi:hypothetical protein